MSITRFKPPALELIRRLKALAKIRGTPLNRPIDEMTTLMLAEFDSETRCRLRAARGGQGRARIGFAQKDSGLKLSRADRGAGGRRKRRGRNVSGHMRGKVCRGCFRSSLFSEKERGGSATPKEEMDIVHARLKIAGAIAKEWRNEKSSR